MREDLIQHMRTKSDHELYAMLYLHREDWTPEALEIAEQEWNGRGLDADKVSEAQTQAEQTDREVTAVSDSPLLWYQRVLFFLFNFLFCLGIPQIVIADVLFKSRGYNRRFRESFIWMAAGAVFFGGLYGLPHWITALRTYLEKLP